MEGWLPTILGTVAGLLSTSSFVPQVIKAWQEGNTEAISKRMYIVTVSAFVLWTVYGFVIGSLPIIIFNAQPCAERHDPVAQAARAAESLRIRRRALRNRGRRTPVDCWPLQKACHAARTERRFRDYRRSAGRRRIGRPRLRLRRGARHPAPEEGGQGLHLSSSPTAAKVDGRGDARRASVPRHPAGLDGRVDLPEGERPSSRRPAATPRAASSTATTRRSARSARARSTST